MKFEDVPKEFWQPYTLRACETPKGDVFIIPHADCHGKPFPQGPCRIAKEYQELGGLVKLRTSTEHVLVRKAEVAVRSRRDIVHQWLKKQFEDYMAPALAADNLDVAARILATTNGGAFQKLRKAYRAGLKTPDWFKPPQQDVEWMAEQQS